MVPAACQFADEPTRSCRTDLLEAPIQFTRFPSSLHFSHISPSLYAPVPPIDTEGPAPQTTDPPTRTSWQSELVCYRVKLRALNNLVHGG